MPADVVVGLLQRQAITNTFRLDHLELALVQVRAQEQVLKALAQGAAQLAQELLQLAELPQQVQELVLEQALAAQVKHLILHTHQAQVAAPEPTLIPQMLAHLQ